MEMSATVGAAGTESLKIIFVWKNMKERRQRVYACICVCVRETEEALKGISSVTGYRQSVH